MVDFLNVKKVLVKVEKNRIEVENKLPNVTPNHPEKSKDFIEVFSKGVGIEEENINILLFVGYGIEPYLNINGKVENLVLITNNCSNLQNEVKLEVNYFHSHIGKPGVALGAISVLFGYPLRSNGKEVGFDQVFELMVQTHHIPVPNYFDLLETIEEDLKVFEIPEKRDGKKIV